MITRRLAAAAAAVVHACAMTLTAQSVYPTGTTIYDPARAWSGYTVLSPLQTQAVVVIDMNGTVVKRWDTFNNSAGGPARVLPGGHVIAASGARPPHQESMELIQRDFDGNVVWQFSRGAQIKTADGKMIWSARQHHDWQRDDFPAGYYSPEYTPSTGPRTTLILSHAERMQPKVADVMLLRYIDVYSTLANGKYTDSLRIDGRKVLARQSDGVHFSREGAVAPARLLLKAMAKDYPALAEDDGP